MYKRSLLGLILLLVSLYPAAAQDGLTLLLPDFGIVQGRRLSVETFDRTTSWERYAGVNGVELGVENGVYRAYTMNPGYVWGLNRSEHTDVILEVEVTPLTPNYQNGFGLVCRADTTNNGDGYYFMMTPSGYYSIQKGQGNGMLPLVDWQRSSAIRPEIDHNLLRAVCVGNHLALYINNELVAEVDDSAYRSGYAGLSVASGSGDVDAAFDNLVTYRVSVAVAAKP
ncbi:MAG: hypothetical protein HZC41_00175 [Chloroflexi bacterium]|nr:hypothetical protein [Chloroflexota bacterium]